MKKIVTILLVAALAATLFVGCSGNTVQEASTDASAATGTQESAADTAASGGGDKIVVSWVSYSINDDFFRAVYTFAQEEADKIAEEDGVEFEFVPYDGQGSQEVQMQLVDTIVTKKDSDIVVLEPVDPNAGTSMVEKINNELGIPVGLPEMDANGGNYIYCSPDNVAATVNAGTYMAELLNEKYGSPDKWGEAGGVIIEMWGPAGAKVCQDRHTGFRQGIDPYLEGVDDVQIVEISSEWDPEKAFNAMSDAIQRYGDDIIAVYADDDTGATEGVWRSLEIAGMAYPIGDEKHIPLLTYDGTDNGLRHVREGHLDLVIEQPAYAEAALTIRFLYQWYKNGYDALPKAGEVLSEQQLRDDWGFGDESGVADWAPVTVAAGDDFNGIWLQPSCPLIPKEADPAGKTRWGNKWYYHENGEWPEGVE